MEVPPLDSTTLKDPDWRTVQFQTRPVFHSDTEDHGPGSFTTLDPSRVSVVAYRLGTPTWSCLGKDVGWVGRDVVERRRSVLRLGTGVEGESVSKEETNLGGPPLTPVPRLTVSGRRRQEVQGWASGGRGPSSGSTGGGRRRDETCGRPLTAGGP